jgi:hypothetical protein
MKCKMKLIKKKFLVVEITKVNLHGQTDIGTFGYVVTYFALDAIIFLSNSSRFDNR